MEEDPRIIKFRPRQDSKRRPQQQQQGSQRWRFNDEGGDEDDIDIMAFIQQLQEELERPGHRGRSPKPKGGAKVIQLPLQRQRKKDEKESGDQ